MKVTATAKNYDPTYPYKRGIKYVSGVFYWCEYGRPEDKGYDARQGTVQHDELLDDFKREIVAASFKHVHYVDWPLDITKPTP